MSRDFDITVFGATGFTGRQAARYLASHADRDGYKLAIAARSADRLAAVAEQLESEGFHVDGRIVADALDGAAMDDLASRSRIVLTTAGPYAKYGNELVRACVEHQTHYVDITGETPWVRGVIDEYHGHAAAEGTRIIPFCGFDSIPSDIGALFAADVLQERHGVDCVRVHGYHRGRGGLNGGTVASMTNMQREGGMGQMRDPFLLNPADRRPKSEGGQGDPLVPFWSNEAKAFGAPFFMGPINTRVVRRSQALLQGEERSPFADEFRYQEYWKAKGLFGPMEAGFFSFGTVSMGVAGALPGMSRLIEKMAADPGEGPSEEAMDGGFFSCDLYAVGEADETGRRPKVHIKLSGAGDPGNRITIKCLCESALLLALQPGDLPESPGGGVLTPASGLGLALVPRLEQAGIAFEVIDD